MYRSGLAETLADSESGADQRVATYTELTALAHGDASDSTTGLATATLHISGLPADSLEDEAKLAERLERFGAVLAVTLRREASWALVTFAEESESERALEGAAVELGAESVVVRRMDTQQALGSMGLMGGAIHDQRRLVEMRVAASCVGPLAETVLCADMTKVDAEEYQRASIVLASLCWMDREVAAEAMRDYRFSASWLATGNALNAALTKDPAQLTRDDAMTVACASSLAAVHHAQGIAGLLARVEGDQLKWLQSVSAQYPLMSARVPIEEVELPRRMAFLLMDICRDPQDACAEAVAGAWMAIAWTLLGRPAVATALLEAGLLQAAVAQLHRSSAVDWANWRSPGLKDGQVFCAIAVLCTLELPGQGMAQRLVDSGMADAMASLLKAYELRGPSKVEEGNTAGILCNTLAMCMLDLTTAEARPIVQILEGMGSALRFTLDHSLVHIDILGQTTAAMCAVLCALVFGKDEDGGGFIFSQELVDEAVAGHFHEMLVGATVPFFPTLAAHFLRPLVHLCISDENKAMLVQSTALIPTLLSALFLDHEHPRKDMDKTLQAGIQCDGAQCFLQLALFNLGKQLLQQHPESLDALRALAHGAALTEEAGLAASAALAAVEGPLPGLAPSIDGDKHVMMSYRACTYCCEQRPLLCSLCATTMTTDHDMSICTDCASSASYA